MAKVLRSRRRALRRRRRPINVAASVVTTFGLYSGIASIFASINHDFRAAAYWILAAIVLDIFDGAVARLTKSVSDFGKELDSLADIVSFGVAPAVLMYTSYVTHDPDIRQGGSVIAILYVIGGALRLARYNSFQSDQQNIFVGLPIPGGAGMIASFSLLTKYFEVEVPLWLFGAYVFGLAALMVSQIKYPKKNLQVFVLAPSMAFRFLLLVGMGIAAFHYARQINPDVVWLPLGSCYVLYGLVNFLIQRFGKEEKGLRAVAGGTVGQKPDESGASKTGEHPGSA